MFGFSARTLDLADPLTAPPTARGPASKGPQLSLAEPKTAAQSARARAEARAAGMRVEPTAPAAPAATPEPPARPSKPEPPPRASKPDAPAAPPAAASPRTAFDIEEPSADEVARASGYGVPPTSFLHAITYTLHVFFRRRELVNELRDAERVEKAAIEAARASLASMGGAVLGKPRADLAPVQTELDAVRATRAIASEHQQSNERTEESLLAARKLVVEKIEAARREMGPLRDRETRLVTTLTAKEQELARVNARVQRVLIEIRNTPPTDADRLAKLDAERAARDAEARALEPAVKSIADELAGIRRSLAEAMSGIAALERELGESERAMRRDEAERLRVGANARAEEERALVALGEAVLARGLASLAGDAIAADVERKLAAVRERKRVARLKSLARNAFDRKSVQKGGIVIGAALALVLAMLFVAIVM
jgi:hypothetical protein